MKNGSYLPLWKRVIYAIGVVLCWVLCYKGVGILLLRSDPYVLEWDPVWQMPLVPEAIVIYLSVYLIPPLIVWRVHAVKEWKIITWLVIAMTIFATVFYIGFPIVLPRSAEVPDNGWGWLLAGIYNADDPVNCFPSTHVIMACLSARWIAWKWPRISKGAYLWAIAVACSTLLIRQHYVVDAVGGWVLAMVIWRLVDPPSR